jgi:pimeloyl-ACP methyl ester carboxylesterase
MSSETATPTAAQLAQAAGGELEILHRKPSADAAGRPPLLLLHGLWHAAWAWESWIGFLAERGYEVVAPSLPGSDNSPGEPRDGTLAKHLALVRGLVDGLGGAPVLFGHSYGGFLIQHLLAERTFPAAVLIASAPHRYPSTIVVRTTLRHPWLMMRSLAARDLTCLVQTPALAREVLFGPHAADQDIVAVQPRMQGAPLHAFWDMRVRVPRRPLGGTPVAVVAGAHDKNFTVAVERRLAQRLGGELIIAEHSGHDIPLDVEWRQIADRVQKWLERVAIARRPALGGIDHRTTSAATHSVT